MRVGVLCEESGTVRDAFIARGHDAVSCDILPRPGPHLRGDCLSFDWSGYDLLVCHPPCTYLSFASRPLWNRPGRQKKRDEAMRFFMAVWNLPVEKMCVENPLGVPNTMFRRPDQIINPFQFGHPERKRTCLWLRGLPPLTPTNEVEPEKPDRVNHRGRGEYWHHRGKRDGRSRSKTFPGIAAAMADQWGGIPASKEPPC